MNPFEYRRVRNVAEAVQALRADSDAKLLAGGQSLLAAMKLRLAAPTVLIDLQGIDGMTALAEKDTGLWMGAMCTHAQVAESALVRKLAPMLGRLAGGIADQQVRNRGTMGGSVSNADPAACWPAGLLAANAVMHTDRRSLSVDEFFTGLFSTALEPDEVLTGIWVPSVTRAAYLKFEQNASRFALTGVAVNAVAGQVRVAVTGLGHGVCRWPEAEAALARNFSESALQGVALDADAASGDLHASAEYRAHLAGVLTRRAVQLIQPI